MLVCTCLSLSIHRYPENQDTVWHSVWGSGQTCHVGPRKAGATYLVAIKASCMKSGRTKQNNECGVDTIRLITRLWRSIVPPEPLKQDLKDIPWVVETCVEDNGPQLSSPLHQTLENPLVPMIAVQRLYEMSRAHPGTI